MREKEVKSVLDYLCDFDAYSEYQKVLSIILDYIETFGGA